VIFPYPEAELDRVRRGVPERRLALLPALTFGGEGFDLAPERGDHPAFGDGLDVVGVPGQGRASALQTPEIPAQIP